MGYSWNNFGVLIKESEDNQYLYIHNSDGQTRQISKSKYATSIADLRVKIQKLLGKPIIFRTSQNTSNWTTSKWFSDINIDETGLLSPNSITPFSKNTYIDEIEPKPGTIAALEAKLKKAEAKFNKAQAEKVLAEEDNNRIKKESQKKALMQSEKIEQLKSDKSEFQDKLNEVELENSRLIAQTKELEETLSFDDKRKIISDADALQKMNLIGSEHSIKARGHPVRELALRVGEIMPQGKKTIRCRFIRHVTSNRYRISLPEFSNVEADAFIRLETTKNMFVASFLNTDVNWFEKFEKKMGEKDESYKNRTDLSYEELVKINQTVMSSKKI